MLDLETAGALVPGRILKEDTVATQKVKILRTFVGLPAGTKIGDIVTISKVMALAARDGHKVEFVIEAEPPAVPEAPVKAEAKSQATKETKEEPKKLKKE